MDEFSLLRLSGWRQFEDVNLSFGESLCVLTGPNGCGKTTVLNVLGRHFGWNINFLSTPFLSAKREKQFWTDVWETLKSQIDTPAGHTPVGTITYKSGAVCRLLAPSRQESGQYSLSYDNQQQVIGLHIPSHRPISSYARLDDIPVNPKTNSQQFAEFQQLLFQTYGSSNVRNPGIVLKQSLIALALFGEGNQHVAPNYEYKALFDGFVDILQQLLPPELGFQKLEVRMPEIVLKTASGDFPLDAMSGGVSSLLGIAWQIHMYGADKTSCTVIIDEPENHLHPSMQRRLLPSLAKAFPKYRFIVSTHSPFIVTSSPDAAVFALVFNESQRVISRRLTDVELAASPNKILQEVLDVPTTIPIWVEDRIRAVLDEHAEHLGDPNSANAIFEDLRARGLDRAFGGFLSRTPKPHA
jgi:predicted ATPase